VTTYTWTVTNNGSVTGESSQAISQATISQTLTGTSTTVNYIVTPTSGTCIGSTFTLAVTVNPLPTFTTAKTDPTACGATDGTITLSGLTASTSYQLTYVLLGVTTGPTARTSDATGKIVISSLSAGSYTVSVGLTSTGCQSATQVVTLINPGAPDINDILDQILCGGSYTLPTIQGSNLTNPGYYNGPNGTGGTPPSIISSIGVTTIYMYSATPGGCSDEESFTVTINAVPIIAAKTATICSGGTFTVTPTSVSPDVVPSGTTYSWSAPVVSGITGTVSGTSATSISGTLTNSTNASINVIYSVTPTANSCPGTPFNVTVTVNPSPVITNMTSTTCSGTPFSSTPVNITNGTVPSGTTYTWTSPTTLATGGSAQATGQSSISQTLTNNTTTSTTATYTVTPTFGTCVGSTFQLVVTVNPKPVLTNTTATICSGGTFTTTPSTGGGNTIPTGTTYSWSAPSVTGVTGTASGASATSISGTLTNTTNAAINVVYVVTPTAGSCNGTTFNVTVTVNPSPSVTSITSSVCTGNTFTVTPVNTTNGIVPSGTTYSWSAPIVTNITGTTSGSSASSISGTLTNSTSSPINVVYTVSPTSGTCLGSDFTVTVTVNPNPVITNMTTTVCSGTVFSVTPVNVTDGTVPTGTTYTWSAPTAIGITGTVSGSAASLISGTLTNTTSSTQTVAYTVTPTFGTCLGTPFTVTVTVNPKPTISAKTATICSTNAFTVSPTDGTSGDIVPTGTTYTWTVVDNTNVSGDVAQTTGQTNISQTLTSPSVQTVNYTVTPTSGTCIGNTFTIAVTVNPLPTFTTTKTDPTACNGSDGTISLNGLTANSSNFQYSYTGPTSATLVSATTNASGQITISGLVAGTYTVTVRNTTTGCTSAEVITILANPGAPSINPIANQTLCGGSYPLPTITGTNLSNAQYWTGAGGTGTVLPVGTVISTIGTTSICMYSATPGGCSDEECFSITINSVPIVSSPANVCVGETVTLSPTSGGSWAVFSGPTFASVQDDGTVLGLLSGSASFIWTESGTNCTNTTTPITVKAVNTVDAGTAQTVCSNTTVTLAGTMGGSATSSNWSGGSGFSSTASLTPTYTLDPAEIGAGSATLTLTAIDLTGICPNVSDQVIITIDQAPVVNAGTNDIFCSSETYQLSASIGGLATNVTWTKTGTSSAASTLSSTSVLNPIYTPSPTDVLQQPITFTATTNDPLGPCLASTSQVTIAISPRVVVNAGNDFVSCADTQVQLNGSITGSITSGTWSGGAGGFTSSANSLTAQYQPTAAELTQPSITLILTSDDPIGPCPAILDSVTISFAQPAIVDAGPDQTICSGVMISQTGSFGGAATSITWASTTMPIIARGTITNSPNALTINYMPSSTEINNLYVDLEIYSNDPAGPCGVERDTVRITINPTPFLLNNTIFSHCSGNALNIPLTVQNNLSSDFVWEMLDNPNISGEPVGLIYTSTITNTLVNNTLIDQIVIINVTPIIAGCIGSPVQLTVTVHPRPTMDPVSNQTLCSLTPTTAVVFNSNILGTTYSWTNDLTSTNIGIGGNGSGNIPVFTPPGFTTTSIANIVVTPEYSGCEGIPVLFSYTFLPVSTVNDPSDIVVCHNQTVPSTIFTGNNPNTVYNWQNSETSIGLISIGQDDISSFTGNNPPPSSLPVISTVTVTPQLNTCFGVPQTFSITVKPIPVLQSINDRRLCIGNISNTIAFPAAPSGTTFAWTNSLPAIGLSAGGTTNFIPSFPATHTTGLTTVNQVDTGYINVIPTFNGCAGLPVNFLIMVNPVLQADPIPDMVFCEGEVFPEIIITGNAPDVNYTWSYNNIATGLAPTGTNVIPSHIVQSGNFGEFGNVTIIPTHPSLPNCLGTQTSFSITVKPKPNVYVSQPVQGACHNVATTAVNFTSDVPNTTFSWQNTNNMSIQVNSILNGISTNSGNLPSFIGHNTTIAPVSQTANYNVFTFSNGCVGDTATFSITVDPKPTVLPENDQTLCAGQTTLPVTFTGNFGGSTTYNWSTNNVSIFPSSVTVPSTNSIPSFNAQNSTSVTQIAEIICVPIFGFCVGDTTKFEFIIKPKPTVNAVPDQSLCSGSLTSLVQFFGNMDVTPSDGAATYNWTNDNISINLVSAGTGNIIPFIAGNSGSTVVTATITVVPEINNCFGDTMTFTITTVDPIPLVDVLTNIELCAGQSTSPICFSGANPVTSFNWTAINGSLIGLSNSGSANSTSGFCIDPFVTTNGSSITDIIATFTVSPVYSGCVGTPRTFDIKVKPVPNVFVTPITQTVCANTITQDVLFTGNIPGTSFGWIGSLDNIGINDVGTSDILSFTALNSTNFDLIDTILVTPTFNGCTGIRDTAFIIVNPISDVNIAIDSFSYCHGDNVPQNCFVGNNLNTVYTWSNDNTAIGLASAGTGCIPSFVAQNTSLQNDTALIIVQPMLNGCLGIPDTIMIYTKPIPNVYSIPDINVCAGVTVPTITFQGDMTNETDFVWSGNTPIGLNPNSGIDVIPTFVGFNNSQVILVNSIITRPQRQGCFGARDTLLISVNPISEVTIDDSLVFCNGVVVPPTVINGTSPIAVYAWTNNNTSIGLIAADTSFTSPHSLPSFTAVGGVVPQIAQIVVTPLVNGCPGVNDTMIITVNPTPIVNPVPSQSLCAGTNSTPIIFTGPVANTTYNWEHFNASTGLVPTSGSDIIPIFEGGPNLYPGPDNVASVTVTPVANGCSGIPINFSITVHPLPIINAGFDTTLCLGQFIIPQGSGLSIAGLSFGFQWTATPGNTIGSTPLNGQPYYPDATTTLSVIGTDMNLCQNVDTLIVTYLQVTSPQVFAGLDTAICFGESITLCAVHDGDLLVWDNGVFDCVEFIPLITNTYIATASHLNGCYSKDTVVVTVNSLPIITANASDDFICDGDMTILWGDGAGIGAVYTWDNSVIDSVGFIPLVTNTYTVIGTDVNGCKDTADIVVTVNPNPIVLFSSNITFGGCLPFAPVFTDLTSPTSASVTWDFGDGNTDNQLGNVVNIYDNFGCYDVTLTSTTPEGCTATLTQQDFVCVNEIIADFYPDSFDQPISNPTFEFTNTSQNATSYEWFFGDLPPSISTAVHPDHTYDEIGFYAVTLVASAQDGCTDTAVIVIKVRDEVLFYVPNSFTPDDNGLNDVFLPVLTAGYDRTGGWQFKIYNRWGEEIFNSDIVGNGWDGTYQGELVQFGTYVWTIRFKDSQSNKIYDFTGHVNLIR
jgi:gliding motility-associated-like protein